MTNVNLRAAIDYAKDLFFEKGNRWSAVEKDLRDLYPELSNEDIAEVKGTLSYLIEQFGIQISSSLRVSAYEGSAGTDWTDNVPQPTKEKNEEKKEEEEEAPKLDALYESDATVQKLLDKLTDSIVDELSNVITVDPSALDDSQKYTLQEMKRINENMDAWKLIDTAERNELRATVEQYVRDMYDKNFKGSVGGKEWTELTGEDPATAELNVFLIGLIDDRKFPEDDARLLHRMYDSVSALKQDLHKHKGSIAALVDSIKKEEEETKAAPERKSLVYAPEQLDKFISDVAAKYKINASELAEILHDNSLYGSAESVISDRVLVNHDLVSDEWFATMTDIIGEYVKDGAISEENKNALLQRLRDSAPLE